MPSSLQIRSLQSRDITTVVEWARQEGFTPGLGDVAIYRHTDRQGLWVGWLGTEPVGCIAGVRYNAAYGFMGLFLVKAARRGQGHGLALWRHALAHLEHLPCIGLEAAPERVADYARWGFQPASTTTRWRCIRRGDAGPRDEPRAGLELVQGAAVPERAVQIFDAQREPSPRPHFLGQWLRHRAGSVLALLDAEGNCHGFGRIRPCLLQSGEGWRIGPLVADEPAAASRLLQGLLMRHPGVVLIDVPAANPQAEALVREEGFTPLSQTLRMYRGEAPTTPLADVYGLACLELG